MFDLTPAQVTQYREGLLIGSDRNLIADVGYFLIWYSTAELGFTHLLALASGMKDLATFDALCGGMDLRVKIERFRRIRKTKGGIGPNLNCRLTYLDEKCRPIRNRLAHCAIGASAKVEDRYLASTLSTMPWEDMGATPGDGQKFNPPVAYTAGQLLGWGAWLAAFAKDLSAAFNQALGTEEYEIKTPMSRAPPEAQGTPDPIDSGAKNDKRAQRPSGKK